MKRIQIVSMVLLSLFFAAGTVSVFGQQDAKAETKARKQQFREEKQARRAEQRKLNEEVGNYRHLRDSASLAFMRNNPPASIMSPFDRQFTISNIICAGDQETGMIILCFKVVPRTQGLLPLLIGGSNSGTRLIAPGGSHLSSNFYGEYYEMIPGISQEIALTFYNVNPEIKKIDRIDIGVGFRDDLTNTIVLLDVPVFWTHSDKAIRAYVRNQAEAAKEAARND